MANKVYLSPPNHDANYCVIPGWDENLENNRYLDELEVFLDACGIEHKRNAQKFAGDSQDGWELMYRAVRESDAWGADVHYVSHTNALDGKTKGCRPMYYTGSEKGKRLGEIMAKHRCEVYPGSVQLIERGDLYELSAPKAISFYEEHVFHDNTEDDAWFHANLREVARSAAKGLCEYFGIPYVEPYKEENEVRYEKLKDVTSETYRKTLDKLIGKKLLAGKGGTGEDLVLDLSEDSVRLLVVLDRAGAFDGD